MALLLVLLFLAFPVAELALIVTVAGAVGVLNTLGLLIAVSILGAWLAKREGLGMVARIQASLDRGELPSREAADGFLILFAGALMIAPGFITDCIALLLLFPPSRVVARRVLTAAVVRRGRMTVVTSYGGRSPGAGGDGIWDAESWEEPPAGTSGRGELGGRQ